LGTRLAPEALLRQRSLPPKKESGLEPLGVAEYLAQDRGLPETISPRPVVTSRDEAELHRIRLVPQLAGLRNRRKNGESRLSAQMIVE
jgi:hypothetical protein